MNIYQARNGNGGRYFTIVTNDAISVVSAIKSDVGVNSGSMDA